MKVVLAYSGGLDTSVCIPWLQEHYGAEVITLTLELGQEEVDLKAIEKKAKKLGALKTFSLDVREEFVREYVFPSIKANGLYEGKYPLSTALTRPLIAKWLVTIAEQEEAKAVAHGATGKGNDQVRFETTIRALNPELKILAPVREWSLTREEEIRYAEERGIDIPVTAKHPYSYDANIWGKSAEGGNLEHPMCEPTEGRWGWTIAHEKAPDRAEYVELEFEEGVPVKLNGERYAPVELIHELNEIGAKHGVGRVDMMEDRLVGIKSRETYECPGATILLTAHKDLESMVLTREQLFFKELVDRKWAQMVYFGQWYEPLMQDLNAFINNSQHFVSGKVRVKLYKGQATVVGRESPYSLYDLALATYDSKDRFEHEAAEGFIKIWGLPQEIVGKRNRKFEK